MPVPSAHASSIHYSGVLNDQIGFGPGYDGPVDIPGAVLNRVAVRGSSRLPGDQWLVVFASGRNTAFARFEELKSPSLTFSIFPVRYNMAAAFARNAMWGSQHGGPGGHNFVPIAATRLVSGYGSGVSAFNRTDRYLLFAFSSGTGPTEYGWAQFDVTVKGHGPDVVLVDYAYDSSGAQLPAGDTGVPEPATWELSGLAALALGARGLRAWRSARNNAARI